MKIGLEVHVALPTKSKLFCSCSMADTEEPNSQICPICLGFPGSKPMLNELAVSSALGIAKALNCKINNHISFVRKVYFYPDLPKCYQITQLDGSIGKEGYLELDEKKVRIRRVQIEEDPAQIIREGALSLLDFNRSGTPLVEIVTEPDIKSEEELRSFIANLRSMLYYLGVDINKEIKADLNISLAETRVEVKNVTGIKSLIEATRFEIERQTEAIKNGEEIAKETRGYNEKSKLTESLREKETDEEYGYIFEPDLTTFDITGMKHKETVYINKIAEDLAKNSDVNPKTIKEITMLDRHSLELINKFKGKYKLRSIIHGIQRFQKYGGESKVEDSVIEKVIVLVEDGKEVTKEMVAEVIAGKEVKVEYAKLTEKQLDKIIRDFIDSNPSIVAEYKRNPKTINLIINKISQKNNLHPKEVARRVGIVLSTY
jgi:aspartyl-tRNA(Asn)/glutamyl-tRNA(Gln) amidotransferase subunit B